MPTINDLKELETPGTPLFLFDCTLPSGDLLRWSTHAAVLSGVAYPARVLRHNLFEMKSSADEATDGISKVSITLANADSFYSRVAWKGAQVTIRFLFYDLKNAAALSETQAVFRGVANPPEESNESGLRLSFTNRLNLQRIFLPEVRIQRRCPWMFPSDAGQRAEAVAGGAKGRFSPFYRCGYSADQAGGVGNLNGAAAFTSCDFTRAQCVERGMFDHDSTGRATRRFGGIEFVPPSVIVRGYGEKGSHLSTPLDNGARYNDFVPLAYGTGWYQPPVVFARNDGNLTHMEVLLGAGEIAGVVKVIVNNIEIPSGQPNTNMTATGWYNLVSPGTRMGSFNPDFALGDPYGSMALLSVVTPNRISDGRALPRIDVLIQGMKLARYDATGAHSGDAFTNNSAWVLLDILRRSGWSLSEIDIPSFAAVAARCDEPVPAVDLHGNPTLVPRFQCNLILMSRRSAADVVRGIRNAAELYLVFSPDGLLRLRLEGTLSDQQPVKPSGSNSAAVLNGGWPAYEFGDNTFSGILRKPTGEAALRTWSRSTADTPNRFTVEFQDEFNEYQQDSLSLVDLGDALRTGQEVTAAMAALALPNFDQARRVMSLALNRSVAGNTYVEFETSVRAVGLKPGDLITMTYAKEGFQRQPFRVVSLAPGTNYRTAVITAQIHDDAWYSGSVGSGSGSGRQPGFETGLPRPLVGAVLDSNEVEQFAIQEQSRQAADGSVAMYLSAGFTVPDQGLPAGLGVPLVGLNPIVDITGGTLAGSQKLYYGVSAVDSSSGESGLSFTIKAEIPAGTNTNRVTLQSLSFPSATAAFRVYRGANPSQLLQIADNVAVAEQFTDTGLAVQLKGPPDHNFDHANFYWRLELQPEATVDIHSANTIGNGTLQMLPNELRGSTVRVTKGTGSGQERTVASNTPTVLTLKTKWDIEPDATSSFVVADSTWQFGATGNASPLSFETPNRDGATVEVSGRAANVRDEESAFELCPLTRWRISGDGGPASDADVPGSPVFGVAATGGGLLEVAAIGFQSVVNTRTVSAGTLTVAFWDELNGPSTTVLAAAIAAASGTIAVTPANGAQIGDLLQVESEVLVVTQVLSSGSSFQVTRGSHGSTAVAHAAQTAVYFLEKKSFILPFPRDFFGSPASGSYAYPVALADARVAAAELFVTNSKGSSSVTRRAFTATIDRGLRTLSGGQLSIQVEGLLAIQTNAAPPLLVESAHSVRDVYAVVKGPSTGTPIELRVTQNGVAYCTLTIPVGSSVSNVVDGFALGPLAVKAQLGLDVLAVSQTANTLPGRDLTVTIRL